MSGVRLYYVVRLYYLRIEDRRYSLGFLCSSVELNLAIITASIPTLLPLGRRCFPSFFTSLGLDRPHCYADIEIMYATNPIRARDTSKAYRSKIVWRDRAGSPSEFNSE